MIIGAHSILYSVSADADRAFFRDVLAFDAVDAGGGWLIFALPPGEIAVHPDEEHKVEFYLMTDDVNAEIARLRAAGVTCADVSEQRWGSLTYLTLPSGAELGLYQPKHPMAIKS